ncbi:MAG: hypothetical protein QUV07_10910 [Cyanobium sp. CZS 25K]|nr:hypothetical protein [Cyanobium sp. CZS25K]
MLQPLRSALVLGLLLGAAAPAQAEYPVVNLVATRVIERYQNSTCEQLRAARSERRGSQEQRVFDLLNDDPQMRQAFFNKIAAPVMNKMFTCGMIP